MRALRVEIEDSGLDSDLSGSNGEEESRYVFVASTSDRMKNLSEQGADSGEPEKRLDSSTGRVTMKKRVSTATGKYMTIVGAEKDCRVRSVAAIEIHRASVCKYVQLVERYMTEANAHGRILQFDLQMVRVKHTCRNVPAQG